MNLYVHFLKKYIVDEWDKCLADVERSNELRFIVQSMGSEETFELFNALDQHRLSWLQNSNVQCYFKVATQLWRDWCRVEGEEAKLQKKMEELNAITSTGERIWIDEDDKLTWYRNRTTQDESADALVVVLVGLSHATDQGGLADFHKVDEERIWQEEMGRSFEQWIAQINITKDLRGEPKDLEPFDDVLLKLFQIRPLQLGKLAAFLDKKVIANKNFANFGDFTTEFFGNLPTWQIPPFLVDGSGTELKGKKGALAIEAADAFLSHKRYKTRTGQNNDWKKITEAVEDLSFVLPETLAGCPDLADRNEYLAILNSFIFEADLGARSRLLEIDCSHLISILGRRLPGSSASVKIPAISGFSFDVILESIWRSLSELSSSEGGKTLSDNLSGVHIRIERFDHDLKPDDDNGVGSDELAKELLRGCLGGLDDIFSGIDCRLPRDEDQVDLPRDYWDIKIPVTFELDFENVEFGVSRARPNVRFEISIADAETGRNFVRHYKWILDPTQAERVNFESARKVLQRWQNSENPHSLLPAYRIPTVSMAALYYAADEDEANRLTAQAITDFELSNLLDGLSNEELDSNLWVLVRDLIAAYRGFLGTFVNEGFYVACANQLPQLLNIFANLAEQVLDDELLGSEWLLRRFYKAFFLVDERFEASKQYLTGCVAWGLSPAVLELVQAKIRFLAEGFPEAIGELATLRDGNNAFEKLIDLSEIHRPLAALVVDQQGLLSAEAKSFGLLHFIGSEPPVARSLAVQTLLRDNESDDDDDVRDIVRRCEERDVVDRVLKDYQQLYPFAQDGLRILAVNVSELQVILSGLDKFLNQYLKASNDDLPPFQCTIMVYSTSSSPMSMENRLSLWREDVIERLEEKGRSLELSIGHRYALKDNIVTLLKQESKLYDIAFLFHFLRSSLSGRADPTSPFELNLRDWEGLHFPISEYPRPTMASDKYVRQSLISNRRLRVQSRHADLSAKLNYAGSENKDHVIYGQVDYAPWTEIVEAMHSRAQWIACIDPFVDKRLLNAANDDEQRKIVGFTSGLGAYGELNLTISTEQDTLKQLTKQVENRLGQLLPFEEDVGFETMASRVVAEAEEIIGLSSLRAVIGADERIREVVGFSAIRRALDTPQGQMSQLLPVDSLLHWFAGSQVTQRPDLLQLSLEVRDNDIPLVHAVLIECKFAQKNPTHVNKAYEQIRQGLLHLTTLLAPSHSKLRRVSFDRRYWWAQLHRAITSRSVVNLPLDEWRRLDLALESLGEGQFEICWQSAIFTFWTDDADADFEQNLLDVPTGIVEAPFVVPVDYKINHFEVGYKNVSALFAEAQTPAKVKLQGPTICLRPELPVEATTPPVRSIEHGTTAEVSGKRAGEKIEQGVKGDEASTKIHNLIERGLSGADADGLEGTAGGVETGISEGDEDHAETVPDVEPVTLSEVGSDREETLPAVSSEPTQDPTTDAFPVLKKVLIGKRSNGEEVYWHYGHPQLSNRHLLIFGASGSGKTYGIQCLLMEMAQQKLHSLIVDYTDGFSPAQLETTFQAKAQPKNQFVITDKLPLNPFARQTQIIDPTIDPIVESPYQIATRVESIFASIFRLGEQQKASLIRAIEDGVGISSRFSLDDMLARLHEESSHGVSLANKLEPLVRAEPFNTMKESTWEEMLTSPENWVYILQLKGLAREVQKMVTEFALWDLWDYAQNTGGKDRPIPVVLDEIQNLDHGADSPIDKMLREGRKFGLSMILATQTTSQFDQEQRDRLFQAGHKLFFKPAATEVDRFAQILAQATGRGTKADWAQRLSALEKGQCWSLGPVLKSGGTFKDEALLTNVTAMEDRTFVD
jgi:DNA phosphorothioation-dependent restriction protein DptH